MGATNIDELSVKISSDATSAVSGIENLTASLEKLKSAVSGIKNLRSTASGITAIADAVAKIDSGSKSKLESLAKGLNSLSSIGSVSGTTIANQINQLKDAVNGLSGANTSGVSTMVTALNAFSTVSLPNISSYGTAIKNLSTAVSSLGKINTASLTTATNAMKEVAEASKSFSGMSGTGFSTIAKSLKEIPNITQTLDDGTVKAFAEACQKVSDAVRPLTSELSSVSPAVAQLMLKLISASNTEDTATRATNALEDAVASLKEELLAAVPGLGTVLSAAKTAGETIQKITRTIKNVVNTIKNVWNTLKNIFNKIKSAVSSIANVIGNVFSGIANAVKKAVSGLTSVVQKLFESRSENSGLIQSFTDLYTKVQSVYSAITTFGSKIASLFENSADYEEMMNMFAVAMGSAAESAYEYAQTVQNAVGIDASDWMENEAVFMNIVHGYGVASDRAATISQQLTQIGYDLSSIWNEDVDTAMQKLQSGISGEIEPLRRWGIDLSQTRLEQEALTLGIDESVSSMTQAEKAQLRYIAIFNQVSEQGVLGDMAKTLNSSANQVRVFTAQITLLGRSIGNIFIPIINKVLPYITAIVKAVRSVVDVIAGFFGYSLPTVSDYSVSVGDSVGDLTDDTSDLASATGDAADAAEEYKNTVLGIDELNLLNDTTSSSSGSSGGGSGSSGSGGSGDWDFDLPTYDFLEKLVEQNVDSILDSFGKLDDFDWVGLRTKVHTAMLAISEAFTNFVDKVPWESIGKFAGEALNTVVQAINTFWYQTNKVGDDGLTTWQRLGQNVSKGLRSFINTVEWKAIGMKLRYKMNSLLDMFSQAVHEFNSKGKNGLTGFEEVGQAIADYLSGVFDIGGKGKSIFTKVADTLTATIKGIADIVSSGIKSLNSRVGVNGNWFQSLGNSIGTALTSVFTDTALFTKISSAVSNFIGSENSGVIGTIKAALDKMNAVNESTGMNSWQSLGQNFAKSVKTIFSMANFKDVVSTASSTFKGIFSVVTTTLNELNNSGYFRGVGSTLASMLNGAFSEDGIFTSLSKTIGAAFGSVVDLLNGFVNEMGTTSGATGMTGWQELGTGIANSFNNIFSDKNVSGFTSGITKFAQGICETLKTAMGDSTVQKKLEEMVKSITESIVDVIKSDQVQQMLLTAMSTTCSVISASLEKSHPFLSWLFKQAADDAKTDANWDDAWNSEVADLMSSNPGMTYGSAKSIVSGRHTNVSTSSSGSIAGYTTPDIKTEAKKNAITYANQFDFTMNRTLKPFSLETTNSDAETTANTIVSEVDSIMSGTAFKANTTNTDASKTAKNMVCTIQGYANKNKIGIGSKNTTSGKAFVSGVQSAVSDSGSTIGIGSYSSTSGSSFVSNLQSQVNGNTIAVGVYATGLAASIRSEMENVQGTIQTQVGGVVKDYGKWILRGYATGGFPDEGQMFIAREAGPELVGTIGGHTAVANNDQIVSAVASGVASANAEEASLLREQNRLLRALLAKDTTVTVSASQIVNGINRASTRSGVSAF
jgi:sugar-specific transcriptional regulator TrmB